MVSSSMLTNELRHLRQQAHRFILNADRSCTPQELARHLFGPLRHEDPVAQLVVRNILDGEPDVCRGHDARWLALDAPFLDRSIDDLRYVVVDLETTGSLIGVDRIIEVGIAVLEGGRVTQRFSSLTQSSRPVTGRIRRLTGIRPSDLVGAPAFGDVAPMVMDMLRSADAFVAHDVRFDQNFLGWELARHGHVMPEMPGLCTLRLAQQLWPDHDGWRLQDLAGSFSVTHDRPHRAGEDALATAGVLAHALEHAEAHGARLFGDLYSLTSLLDDSDDADGEMSARAG
jgi:DNA polymerase III epsilon subunit-like protein